MRRNKFNLLMPFGNNEYLLYNPLTNALCRVHDEVVAFLEGKNSSLSPEVVQDLVKGLFWVPDNFSELSYIDHIFYSQKYSSVNIGFTIIPTLFCNLRCLYCYEFTTDLNISMDDAIIEKTFIFINKKIDELHPASLHITWYGGEPLLKMEIIYKISQAVINVCERRNIKYTAGIITNGTLLSKSNSSLLLPCKINRIQVTIDGPPEIHDKRRPFKDGKGTYDIIMKNILDTLTMESSVKVILRINIDKQNEEHILSLLTTLSSLVKDWDRLGISFGQVFSTSSLVCKSQMDTLFTPMSFARFYLKIINEMRKLNLQLPYLYPSFNTCTWKTITNWVIGPRGELYACWDDVGDEDKTVGNVEEGIDLMRKQTWEWIFSNWRATEDCLRCPIIPICLGGCPRRWKQRVENSEVGCNYLRYIFKQLLHLHTAEKVNDD